MLAKMMNLVRSTLAKLKPLKRKRKGWKWTRLWWGIEKQDMSCLLPIIYGRQYVKVIIFLFFGKLWRSLYAHHTRTHFKLFNLETWHTKPCACPQLAYYFLVFTEMFRHDNFFFFFEERARGRESLILLCTYKFCNFVHSMNNWLVFLLHLGII
jgi:hypothetical protein